MLFVSLATTGPPQDFSRTPTPVTVPLVSKVSHPRRAPHDQYQPQHDSCPGGPGTCRSMTKVRPRFRSTTQGVVFHVRSSERRSGTTAS